MVVGPLQFDSPFWLWLIPILGGLAVLIGRRSLSATSSWSRRAGLALRLLVIAALAGALAEPQWRRVAEKVAATVILDASRSVPKLLQDEAERYFEQAAQAHREKNDELGVVTAARGSNIQALPSSRLTEIQKEFIGAPDGTDLAGALRLGMAIRKKDAGYRMVLVSDGNETVGSLLQAAASAVAAGVPVDVLPLTYDFRNEVIVESLTTPGTARMNETAAVRVVLRATTPATGRLNLSMNGQPIDLDPEAPGISKHISLHAGQNVVQVEVPLAYAGAQQFKAEFLPDAGPGGEVVVDTIPENNENASITFVSSEGRVAIFADTTEEAAPLVEALRRARIAGEVYSALAGEGPSSITELNGFDAVFLINQPASNFPFQMQEDLKQYVHDSGGGLMMVGGPDSFGAGGWIGSPLADAIPVRMDPPQKKQMPRGALVLVMHSIEMPQGVYYGQQTAKAAVDALSRLDLVGICEYAGFSGTTQWVLPLSVVGDKSAANSAINRLQFGDMPDFDPTLNMALKALEGADAGIKHCIIISDGDPALRDRGLLRRFKKARITISTVGVYPHSAGDLNLMRTIADETGGNFYEVAVVSEFAKLPQIFVKEAQTVRRSLIWEGDPFQPRVTGALSAPMSGFNAVPPISGYVIAGEREGLAVVTLRGKENDPIAAEWQYGLGRVSAFTSDATSRWCSTWMGWGAFQQFWEQHARWIMRPTGSANLRIVTDNVGDETRIIVEAFSPDGSGERLNFGRFRARVARPDREGEDVELLQVGPGRYEGSFRSDVAGNYIVNLRYAAPNPAGGEPLVGAAQTGVSRPFADEYRSLASNLPLLQQVATMTGGRILPSDPEHPEANIWRRDGIEMPVALRPIWPLIALIGIGLFIADVGVRRVRIDILGLLRLGAARSRATARAEMANLRTAREQARQRLAERGATATEIRAAGETAEQQAKATARVKFEATNEQIARAPVVDVGGPPAPAGRPRAAVPDKQAPGEGMSRLLKAKKRAQDEMQDEV